MSQKSGEPRGVFDDFSFISVVASALTAATSFLLSSKIGLAGSLIGAVIAAVISTAATQVYRGMLVVSTEKIKYAAESTHMMTTHLQPQRRNSHIVGRLVTFAVAISLLGVLASAAFIAFATRGEGLGPTDWEPTVAVEEVTEELTDQAKEAKETVEDVEAAVASNAEQLSDAGTDGQATDTTEANEAQADTVEEPVAEPEAEDTEADQTEQEAAGTAVEEPAPQE